VERGMGAVEEVVMQRFFSADTLASANPMVDSIRTTLLSTSPVGYAGCCAAVRDMDQRPLLGSIKRPVLVIGGDRDVSTPWAGNGDVLAEGIEGARALRLPAGHLSNVEQPSSFSAALFDFLLPGAPADALQAGLEVRRSVLSGDHRRHRIYTRISGDDHT
jgi:pimeloyl-ACP methyl ester carboxylesterase